MERWRDPHDPRIIFGWFAPSRDRRAVREVIVWFKHRAWIPVAWVLSLVNVGAVWFAAAPGEPLHATVHAALGVLFAVGAQRLTERRRALPVAADRAVSVGRMKDLEHAIDAVAVELERIGEGQRYVTKLLAERDRPGERPESAAPPTQRDQPRGADDAP